MALFLLQVRDPIPGASMQFSTLIIFISEQLSSMEGGPNLAQDRLALPILTESDHGSIRCQTGSAVITGPNSYDKLLTNYVIHAVGPNYWDFINEEEDGGDRDSARIQEAHKLLASAYKSSLTLAARYDIRSLGFSLLSAGVYRGNLPLESVLRIGVTAVQEWAQEAPEHFAPLDITMCAFTANECSVLQGICDELFDKR